MWPQWHNISNMNRLFYGDSAHELFSLTNYRIHTSTETSCSSSDLKQPVISIWMLDLCPTLHVAAEEENHNGWQWRDDEVTPPPANTPPAASHPPCASTEETVDAPHSDIPTVNTQTLWSQERHPGFWVTLLTLISPPQRHLPGNPSSAPVYGSSGSAPPPAACASCFFLSLEEREWTRVIYQ